MPKIKRAKKSVRKNSLKTSKILYPPSQKILSEVEGMKAKNSASAGFRSAEARRSIRLCPELMPKGYHERQLMELHQSQKKQGRTVALTSFYQLIADIKSPQEAEKILTGLFSKSEIDAVAKKLAVAKALRGKVSYLQIRKTFNVSSATISQIQSLLKSQPGILLALNKMAADEWAERWSAKIKKLFG